MNDAQDRKLEALLRSRRFEPASAALAQRIVRAARQLPQQRGALLGAEWLRQLFAEFRLPRPAYVLAGTLLIGFAVGWSARFEAGGAEASDASYVQSFLYADDSYADDAYADEELL